MFLSWAGWQQGRWKLCSPWCWEGQMMCTHACSHHDIVLYKLTDDPMVCSISNPDFVIYSSVVSFYLPFVVTLLVYIRIYVFLRMRRKRITFGQTSGKVLPDSTPPSVVRHSSLSFVCLLICGVAHFNKHISFLNEPIRTHTGLFRWIQYLSLA